MSFSHVLHYCTKDGNRGGRAYMASKMINAILEWSRCRINEHHKRLGPQESLGRVVNKKNLRV